MPGESFSNDFISVNLNELRSLKIKWNVSIAAMIMRASNLGIISDEQKDRLWRNYSRQGFNKKEPLDNDIQPEKPFLLKKAVQMIIEGNQQDKLQVCLSLPFGIPALEEITGVPSGYFGINQIGKLLKFKKTMTEEYEDNTNDYVESKVIPFKRKQEVLNF